MSTIKQALSNLSGAVGRLENSIDHIEAALAGKQRDMFNAPAPPPLAAKRNGSFTGDNSVIAQRLDKAIKRVEELLEG